MGKTYLPPGFRFRPTDVELVKYYLKRKVTGKKLHLDTIAEVDIYKFAPWDLPDKSHLRSGDLKWYFFCPREKKYATGARLKRATEFGFWKATGKDRAVLYGNEVAGMIKTLVFHCGKAPQGERTDWVMHEYRLEDKNLATRGVVQDAYVLCMIFKKDGPGPRNGAQYGAPFREEDWSDDEDVGCTKAVSVPCFPMKDLSEPVNQYNFISTSSHVPINLCVESLAKPCAPDIQPSGDNVPPPLVGGGNSLKPLEAPEDPDNVISMLKFFMDDEDFVWNGNSENGKTDDANQSGNAASQPHLEGNNNSSGSGDFSSFHGVNIDGCSLFGAYSLDETLHFDALVHNASFVEMFDLDAPINTHVQAGVSNHLQVGASQCYTFDNTPGQLHCLLDRSSASMHETELSQIHLHPAEDPQKAKMI